MTNDGPIEILYQGRVNATAATSILSPDAGQSFNLEKLIITNVTAAPVDVTVYLDADGTTYDQTTCIGPYEKELLAEEWIELFIQMPLNSSAGNLAVKNSVANAVNYTLSGYEKIRRQ